MKHREKRGQVNTFKIVLLLLYISLIFPFVNYDKNIHPVLSPCFFYAHNYGLLSWVLLLFKKKKKKENMLL